MESPHRIFNTHLTVRPDDIDMHQHVRSSRYLDYVLAARLDQMKRCYGMSMEAFHERGLTWFVKNVQMEHHRGLRLGEAVTVRTSILKIAPRSVTVIWEIIRTGDDRLAAEGSCTYTLVKYQTGRPQRIPEDVIALYSV